MCTERKHLDCVLTILNQCLRKSDMFFLCVKMIKIQEFMYQNERISNLEIR